MDISRPLHSGRPLHSSRPPHPTLRRRARTHIAGTHERVPHVDGTRSPGTGRGLPHDPSSAQGVRISEFDTDTMETTIALMKPPTYGLFVAR